MNKKLLTVAVAAGVAATSLAAIADVKVYGRVEVEMISLDNSAAYDESTVNDPGQSRFGIKATEKLGGGLTGIAVLEYKATPDDAGGPSGRQQFVGLKGKFGTFAMGSFNGAYKTTGGVKLDPFNATFLEARGNGGQTYGAMAASSFVKNAMSWTSPSVNGIKAQVVVSDENRSGAGNDWQVAVNYKNGPMWGFVAHSESPGSAAGGGDQSLTKIGGRMSMANHTFWVQYEDDDGGLNTGKNRTSTGGDGMSGPAQTATQSGDIFLVGYKMKLGKNEIVVQYGETDYESAQGTGSYTMIGARHRFSKSTSIYGGWRQTDEDVNGSVTDEVDVIGFGIRKDF